MKKIIQGDSARSASSDNSNFSPLEKNTDNAARPGFTGLARVGFSDSGSNVASSGHGQRRKALYSILNILLKDGPPILNVGGGVGKRFRTRTCTARPLPGHGGAGVMYSPATGRAGFSGLQVCGSVWTCPVCGDRICRQRAEDLTRLINRHTSLGGEVLLLTFTAPHSRSTDLREFMDLFQRSYDGATNCKAIKTLKRRLGFIGAVTSKEVTHGDVFGFHAHYHVLWFVRFHQPLEVVKEDIFKQWYHYAMKRGLGRVSERAFDVRLGTAAGEYVSKMGWNVAAEVALSGEKRGRDSRHPFDLLVGFKSGAIPEGLALFIVYASATWGRRFMTSYKALARKLGVDLEELTDDQIAERQERETILIGNLSPVVWQYIVRQGLRAAALNLVEKEMAEHGDHARTIEAVIALAFSVGE